MIEAVPIDKEPDAFRTISEAAKALGTANHVLRFWESRFPQIKPVKRAGGRRFYRPTDIALLFGIKKLLHHEGLSIRGVQKVFRDKGIKFVIAIGAQTSAEPYKIAGLFSEKLAPVRPPTLAEDLHESAPTMDTYPEGLMARAPMSMPPHPITPEPIPQHMDAAQFDLFGASVPLPSIEVQTHVPIPPTPSVMTPTISLTSRPRYVPTPLEGRIELEHNNRQNGDAPINIPQPETAAAIFEERAWPAVQLHNIANPKALSRKTLVELHQKTTSLQKKMGPWVAW